MRQKRFKTRVIVLNLYMCQVVHLYEQKELGQYYSCLAMARRGAYYARSADSIVFTNSITIVIGPTPPGTGVIALAT